MTRFAKKATDAQRAALRKSLHDYVDRILDLEPFMRDLALTNGDRVREDFAGGRQKGTVSRPTESQAMRFNPFRKWLSDVSALVTTMQRLRDIATAAAGAPVEMCSICAMPLMEGEPTHTSQGKRSHRRCYDKGRQR